MAEAKKNFEESMEKAYDVFNPQAKFDSFRPDNIYEFEGDYKTFPEQVDRVVKVIDTEIKKREELIPELEEEYKEAREKQEKAIKEFKAGEGKYKEEKRNIKANIAILEEKQKRLKNDYNYVKPAFDAFTNTYKETFDKAPNREYVEMVPLIQQQAAEWLKIEGLHSGKHKNSIEYDRMIDSFKMVRDWPDSGGHSLRFKEEELPRGFEDALAFMKEQAEKYQQAKNKQIRPFPSRLRTHRNNMTKFILGFAEKAQQGIAAQQEVVSLDDFLQTKGVSRGLDLGKDDLVKEVMEVAKLELPKGNIKENKKLETQNVKTETSKEKTEMEAPEMEEEGPEL